MLSQQFSGMKKIWSWRAKGVEQEWKSMKLILRTPIQVLVPGEIILIISRWLFHFIRWRIRWSTKSEERIHPKHWNKCSSFLEFQWACWKTWVPKEETRRWYSSGRKFREFRYGFPLSAECSPPQKKRDRNSSKREHNIMGKDKNGNKWKEQESSHETLRMMIRIHNSFWTFGSLLLYCWPQKDGFSGQFCFEVPNVVKM